MKHSRRSTIAFTVADHGVAAHASVLIHDLARVHPRWARALVSTESLPIRLPRGTHRLSAADVKLAEWVAFAVSLPKSSTLAALVPWTFQALFAQGYDRVVYSRPRGPLLCPAPGAPARVALERSGARAPDHSALHRFTDSGGARAAHLGTLRSDLSSACPRALALPRCWRGGWTPGAAGGSIPIGENRTIRPSRCSSSFPRCSIGSPS